MAEYSTDPIVAAYQNAFLRCISKKQDQLIRGQDLQQATLERIILTTGQVLEAIRQQQMASAPPTSGPTIWSRLNDLIRRFETAHKLWRLWCAVRLPAGIASYGYIALRWLGFFG